MLETRNLSSSCDEHLLAFGTFSPVNAVNGNRIVCQPRRSGQTQRITVGRGIETEQEKIVPGFTDISLDGGGHSGRLYRNNGLPDTPSSQPGDPLARVSAQTCE